MVLVFSFIFLIMLGGLLTFILIQHKVSVQNIAWEESLRVAESGIDYYKWCLNNGAEDQCQMQRNYYDQEGVLIGDFSLEVISDVSCGETISRRIYSTGRSSKYNDVERTLEVAYGRMSIAKFAYLLNDNVWAGPDRQIKGLYHSNGGIRMDGENQSLISSTLNEWVCTSSFGCSTCPVSSGCRIEGSNCICPGVFTTTENPRTDLFSFPVSPFDFAGITVDLAGIKSKAQSYSIYLPPSGSIDSSADGYHLVFKPDGTVEVRIITRLWSDWAYSEEQGWHNDYFRIRDEYLYNTYSIESSCPVIFVEDNLWVEGTIAGKVTLASANLISPAVKTNIILVNDIDYAAYDENHAFMAIAENNVLISPSSPDNMFLHGIIIAQNGHFGINHYPDNIKNNLELNGSVVSNGRVGTQWISGSYIVSGYLHRQNYTDPDLIYSALPFVPYSEYEFKAIKWEELD